MVHNGSVPQTPPPSPTPPLPAQVGARGRSSGRKRTPKACDCCGPNSKHHDGKTPGGKPRQRRVRLGNGRGQGVGENPKRKVGRPPFKKPPITEEQVTATREELENYSVLEQVTHSVAQPVTNSMGQLQLVTNSLGQPQAVTNSLGQPQAVTNSVGPPQRVTNSMGPPQLVTNSMGPPQLVTNSVGPPQLETNSVGQPQLVTNSLVQPQPVTSSVGQLLINSVSQKLTYTVVQLVAKSVVQPVTNALVQPQANFTVQPVTDLLVEPVTNSLVADSDMEQEQTSEGAVCEGEQARGLEKEPEAGLDKPPLTENKTELLKLPQSFSSEPVVSFSNGISPVHKEEPTDCGTPMEVEPSAAACVSPGIFMFSNLHPFALWDHRDYCKMGVWGTSTKPEVDPTKQTEPSPQSKSEHSVQVGIRDLIHEFLELFYVKYGSFIPLSESDVIDHLKNKCNNDLNEKKLNINSEVVRYKAGLASTPMNLFKVDYNKHTLTLEDLSTLDDQNWVNDQVINMYGELIMEATQHKVHFFNSFFHRQLVAKGYEGVKRWTKKVDLFSKRLLLIPIHLEIHWSLITVDIANRHIHYYDSQGMVFKYTIENIMRYILAEAKEKKQAGYQKGWKMVINKGIPQQKNDSDCGVFVLEYCKCLALKEPLEFTQNDMPKVRKRIYKELCECKLID
ncbi:sentrin-specific protease 5 [Esox lucius]|uniref:sentrin-specific protease 5 n=1 Tax=Esox lucius TaxID=8010 RepID=UPI0014774D84|nr:sentrin-specific protease 5 [Esox lucius]XP_010870825.2 sentrin-specific protease 5 [Esox lucius]